MMSNITHGNNMVLLLVFMIHKRNTRTRKNIKSSKRNEYEYQIITICLKLFIVEYF